FSRACANTGKRIAARIAIMAITTSSSISVNPCLRVIPALLHPRQFRDACIHHGLSPLPRRFLHPQPSAGANYGPGIELHRGAERLPECGHGPHGGGLYTVWRAPPCGPCPHSGNHASTECSPNSPTVSGTPTL